MVDEASTFVLALTNKPWGIQWAWIDSGLSSVARFDARLLSHWFVVLHQLTKKTTPADFKVSKVIKRDILKTDQDNYHHALRLSLSVGLKLNLKAIKWFSGVSMRKVPKSKYKTEYETIHSAPLRNTVLRKWRANLSLNGQKFNKFNEKKSAVVSCFCGKLFMMVNVSRLVIKTVTVWTPSQHLY